MKRKKNRSIPTNEAADAVDAVLGSEESLLLNTADDEHDEPECTCDDCDDFVCSGGWNVFELVVVLVV